MLLSLPNNNVNKSRYTFQGWKINASKRTDLFHDFPNDLWKGKENLARISTTEMGKVRKEARSEAIINYANFASRRLKIPKERRVYRLLMYRVQQIAAVLILFNLNVCSHRPFRLIFDRRGSCESKKFIDISLTTFYSYVIFRR